jgi:hypothetical protein
LILFWVMKIKCDSYVNYYKFVMVVELGEREKVSCRKYNKI